MQKSLHCSIRLQYTKNVVKLRFSSEYHIGAFVPSIIGAKQEAVTLKMGGTILY